MYFYHAANKAKELQTFLYMTQNVSLGPNCREGVTLTAYGSKLLLYGGLGVVNVDELYEAEVNRGYSLNKEVDKYKWRKVMISGEISKHSYYVRFDHAAAMFKNHLIILGGE